MQTCSDWRCPVFALGQEIAGVDFQWDVISDPTEADWTTGNVPLLDLKNFNPEKLTMGTIDTASGYATGESLVTCMSLLKSGKIDGFVFAPLNKEAFKKGAGILRTNIISLLSS